MGTTIYTKELGDRICARLAEGDSLRAVASDEGISPGTVLNWAQADTEFDEQYARARATGYRLLAEEILAISDEEGTMVRRDKHGQSDEGDPNAKIEVVFDSTAVARNKLRVDSRKWILSKMLPKVYGDRLELAGGLDVRRDVASMTDLEILAEVKRLTANGANR